MSIKNNFLIKKVSEYWKDVVEYNCIRAVTEPDNVPAM